MPERVIRRKHLNSQNQTQVKGGERSYAQNTGIEVEGISTEKRLCDGQGGAGRPPAQVDKMRLIKVIGVSRVKGEK